MFAPDDPLAPPERVFEEPWQAQALALADAFVRSGRFTAGQWAEALGLALDEAKAANAPDTLNTYYCAVVTALERLSEAHAGITAGDLKVRRAEWEEAYHHTPHGAPVELGKTGSTDNAG